MTVQNKRLPRFLRVHTTKTTQLIFIALPVFLAACSSPSTPSGSAHVRILALSDNTTLNLSVTLEGKDGQSLSGALVRALSPAGDTQVLAFDSRKSAYTLSSPAVAGNWQVLTSSVAAGQSQVSVPVVGFANAPTILALQDGLGNDALNFQRLSVAQPIRVEWRSLAEAQRYLVSVKQGSKTVWNSTVPQASTLLPPGTLQTGQSATLLVTAVAESGDASFETQPSYSSTTLTGPGLTFQVGP